MSIKRYLFTWRHHDNVYCVQWTFSLAHMQYAYINCKIALTRLYSSMTNVSLSMSVAWYFNHNLLHLEKPLHCIIFWCKCFFDIAGLCITKLSYGRRIEKKSLVLSYLFLLQSQVAFYSHVEAYFYDLPPQIMSKRIIASILKIVRNESPPTARNCFFFLFLSHTCL